MAQQHIISVTFSVLFHCIQSFMFTSFQPVDLAGVKSGRIKFQ